MKRESHRGVMKILSLSFFLPFIAGIIFWGGFNWSMELTNTESFCISCHEMNENVFQEYKKSIHNQNPAGVRATCPDCHVPKKWIHKVVRKVRATNELYHWAKGSIDTREKFVEKRPELASHVWEVMQQTDSRECRNCHDDHSMARDKQSLKAGKLHELSIDWGMTCIQCHQGIAHTPPKNYDREAVVDGWHKLMEQEKIACNECHEDMQAAPDKGEW